MEKRKIELDMVSHFSIGKNKSWTPIICRKQEIEIEQISFNSMYICIFLLDD